jgi:hypothetical protein
MDNEQPNEQDIEIQQSGQNQENEPNGRQLVSQPNLRDILGILKESYADTLNVLNNTREVTGRPKQIAIGAMLGISIVFLIALLSTPHLDARLAVAAGAFGIALPFLIMDFIVASYEFKPDQRTFMVSVLKFAAFRVCEFVGAVCLAVGIGAVLWHFSGTTLIVVIVAVGMTILTPAIVLGVIVVWLFALNVTAHRTGIELDVVEAMRKSVFLSLFVPDTTKANATKPTEPPAAQQTDTLP